MLALLFLIALGLTTAPRADAAVDLKVNFQPAGSAVPTGYIADAGGGYDAGRGFGWVRDDSLEASTHTPLDVSPNARERNAVADQRLDTLIHMQYPPSGPAAGAVRTPAAWEVAVPAGSYTVTVGVGDPSNTDSTHRVAVEGQVVIAGFTPTSAALSATATTTVAVTDGRVTVSARGGTNTKLAYAEVRSAPPPTAVDLKVDFQPAGVAVAPGYTPDTGAAYDDARGRGWVRQDSLGDPRAALDVTANARDRNVAADQRLDTFIHMQYPASGTGGGVRTPAAWEVAVPNGAYDVTVGVGDASAVDSVHRIALEGQVVLAAFTPSAAERFTLATRTVTVTDGRLTVDATGGTNTKLAYVTVRGAPAGARPAVRSTRPADGATGVARDTAVTAEVLLPNLGAGIDAATLDARTVRLVRASDGAEVSAQRNTSGGGDVIVVQPTTPLDATSAYFLEVTTGLRDVSGAAFTPGVVRFATGTAGGGGAAGPIQFSRVSLPTAAGRSFTSLVVGPDRRLYAGTLSGDLVRYAIAPDGTLGPAEVITSLRQANGGADRHLIGLAFDPAATAGNLVLWVSHGHGAFADAPEWSGKITRLTGPGLTSVQDVVTGLPRSVRDHETNSLAFGPDGALYVSQGSLSAMGAPDSAWGMRPERALSAAILRVDTAAIARPLDVRTDGGAGYDPSAPTAPVTVFASGVRNAYDLVWHSNGQLYVPANGSAAGGNAPATPGPLPAACGRRIDAAVRGSYTGPLVPALSSVVAQDDFLFRVRPGAYYGHPNPARCEWVLNGGNPTSGADPAQVDAYPVGTQPDRNWSRPAFTFGLHYSPNGVVEYRGGAFGGALRGRLLVVRYSAGDDVIALTPGGAAQDIVAAETNLGGLSGFVDPLDIVEDRATGNLYVSELGAARITLLRPG